MQIKRDYISAEERLANIDVFPDFCINVSDERLGVIMENLGLLKEGNKECLF